MTIPGHFCGTILDWARTCYRSKMRFWQDSMEEVEGYWFFTPPGAKWAPNPHPFAVRVWRDPRGPRNAVGEVWEDKIRYYKGGNPLGYTGQFFCPPGEWIRRGGIHGIDPEITTLANGSTPCCFPVPPPPPPPTRHPGSIPPVRVSTGAAIFGTPISLGSHSLAADETVILCVAVGNPSDPWLGTVDGFDLIGVYDVSSLSLWVFRRTTVFPEPGAYTIAGQPGLRGVSAFACTIAGGPHVEIGPQADGMGQDIAADAASFGEAGSVATLHVAVQPGSPFLTDPVITSTTSGDVPLYPLVVPSPPYMQTAYGTAGGSGVTKTMHSTQSYAWLSLVISVWSN